jgi:Zn-dependent protease with chaperone function
MWRALSMHRTSNICKFGLYFILHHGNDEFHIFLIFISLLLFFNLFLLSLYHILFFTDSWCTAAPTHVLPRCHAAAGLLLAARAAALTLRCPPAYRLLPRGLAPTRHRPL